MAHFKWVVERPWPRVPLSENPTAAVVAFWRLDVVGVVAVGLVVAAAVVVMMVASAAVCSGVKEKKDGRQRRRDRRGRLGGNSSISTSQPTRRHRMCTANYLRPLDEIICLSKRQINTKPNYPAKGSALFASCARPVRLFLRIKFGITLFSFFLSLSFSFLFSCAFVFLLFLFLYLAAFFFR